MAHWLGYRAEDLEDGWRVWRSAAAVVPWALIGLVLAKGRGWTVPARLAGLAATWFVLGAIVLRLGAAPSTAVQRWRDVVLMLATATVWLIVERRVSAGSRGTRPT